MITIPRHKIAVIPIYDSEVSRGGIVKPSSFDYVRDVQRYDIYGTLNHDKDPFKIDEAEDKERADYLIKQYKDKGYIHVYYRVSKESQATERLDSGERCDQGIVKYVGREVKDIKIGDYVFFGGYSGTLLMIEGEGRLIILPETFVECVLEDDEIKKMEIPGLYFREQAGIYFPATYEQAMNIIAETFTLLNKTVEVKSSLPKLEDYDVR